MEQKPKLLEQVRAVAGARYLSHKTEDVYHNFIKRFILFHNKRHPKEMGAKEITDFLTYLAVKENVSASTQNQALFALLFLYRDVLKIDLPRIEGVIRQRRANYADLHAPFEKQIFCQKSARHLSNCAACRFK